VYNLPSLPLSLSRLSLSSLSLSIYIYIYTLLSTRFVYHKLPCPFHVFSNLLEDPRRFLKNQQLGWVMKGGPNASRFVYSNI
jgi:hypothetical protein